MTFAITFILGVVAGYILSNWWIRPDLIELRTKVAEYERLREARIQRGLELLRGHKAAQGIEIDGDDG